MWGCKLLKGDNAIRGSRSRLVGQEHNDGAGDTLYAAILTVRSIADGHQQRVAMLSKEEATSRYDIMINGVRRAS